MRGSYNLTLAGFRHAEQHGITPEEVWEVLGSERRLYSPVDRHQTVIYGATAAGRFLALLVREDDFEDDVWDIVAARDMTEREISELRRLRGGDHE